MYVFTYITDGVLIYVFSGNPFKALISTIGSDYVGIIYYTSLLINCDLLALIWSNLSLGQYV